MDLLVVTFVTFCVFVQGIAYQNSGYTCYDCRYRYDYGCGPLVDATKLRADKKVKTNCRACATYAASVLLNNATLYRSCVAYTKQLREHERICLGDYCNGDVPGIGRGSKPGIDGACFLIGLTLASVSNKFFSS